MDKRLLVVLVVVVVALVGVVFVAQRGEKGVVKKTEPHPFPALKVDRPKDPKKRATWESPLRKKIDRLEISKGGKTIVLKRVATSDKKNDVGTWEIVSPFKYPANKSKIRSLMSRLERLDFWEVLTKDPADFDALQVSDEKGTRLRVFAGDELLADMLIGKTISAKVGDRTQTYTAVRKSGTNTVWKLMGSMSYIFGKELDQWRELNVVGKRREDMALLAAFDADGSYIAAARNPDETDSSKKYRNWELLAARPSVPDLDQIDFGRIASTLSSLRARKFPSDVDMAKAGLDKPRRILVAVYKRKEAKKSEARPRPARAEARTGKPEKQSPAEKQNPARKAPAKTPAPGTDASRAEARPAPGAQLPQRAKALEALVKKLHPGQDEHLERVLQEVAAKMADPNYEVFVVLIGKEKPKDKLFYAKLDDRKEIFLLASYSVKTLTKRVRDLADHTLFRIPPEDVSEILVFHEEGKVHIKKEKGGWKAVEPKDLDAKLNRDMVKRVVDMLESRFRAREFASTTDPKTTGLARPKGRVIIKTTKGKTYELLVGKEAKKNQWYVQVKGRRDIFVMGTYPLKQLYKPPKKWEKPGK